MPYLVCTTCGQRYYTASTNGSYGSCEKCDGELKEETEEDEL